MSRFEKTFEKVMSGTADANIRYDDMVLLLRKLGFVERRADGSHAIFQDGPKFVNLQNQRGMVKKYQVRQTREILKNR
jgi:hypothetical protein